MSVTFQLSQIRETLPPTIDLVAVSKFQDLSAIEEAYHAGQRMFGENRVQELLFKYDRLPKDIQWHFIGHLQLNKAKYIAPFVDTVQSADSLRLLNELNQCAGKFNRRIPTMLQVHIAQEEHKFGFFFEEIEDLLRNKSLDSFVHLKITGLMGIATYTEDQEQIRKEFSSLAAFFRKMKNQYFVDNADFKELSMGMSDDYRIAVEEGSTMVRIGSKIFGLRKNTDKKLFES
ncbi:MAG: YggS family pyridoxal phosphate-dependent enzyme [Candidatus Azobacteroides sp.]|nr:YggS family pyridoxal phosphate-dependent enzyme [Candidatus Azobacteroides sp.]